MGAKETPAKIHTLSTALDKVRKYCAYQERSQQEVRDKFYDLGLHSKEVEQGIVILIEEGFINEERFAMSFAGGKCRMKQWGRDKIKAALRQKKVSDYCIRKALNAIPDGDYIRTLETILTKKSKEVKEKNGIRKNYLLARYAMSRGFEGNLVWEVLKADPDG
ncbi:MAG: RecX family transcriptional regulator [Bacteroidetes bacterium]|nr:RecX family transcriptional regulator [Bacteroidota bacterium]